MCRKSFLGLLMVILINLITGIQCYGYQLLKSSDHSRASHQDQEARMFGGIVGIIVENIDWLPIEVNVIDIVTSAISFITSLFESTTSTITSMTD